MSFATVMPQLGALDFIRAILRNERSATFQERELEVKKARKDCFILTLVFLYNNSYVTTIHYIGFLSALRPGSSERDIQTARYIRYSRRSCARDGFSTG